MAVGLRELRVWQLAVALAGDVIRALRPHGRREAHAVADAVQLTALAVGGHIADGYARPGLAEQRQDWLAARRALLRLETELAVARHAELLPAGTFSELSARIGQVAQLLTGYVVYLDRQLAGDAGARPVTPDSGRAPS